MNENPRENVRPMANREEDFPSIQQRIASGAEPDAVGCLRTFLETQPDHVGALQLLSRVECRAQQYDTAIQTISRAIALKPREAPLHHQLGNIHRAAGDLDASIAAYRQGLSLRADDAKAFNNLGIALKAQGNLVKAASAFQSALHLQPELAFPYRNLAEVQRLQGKGQEAAVNYQQALRLAPDDAQAHNGLGLVYTTQGQPELAAAEFEKAIQFQADYEEAENNLGTVLCALERLDEAVALYQRLLDRQPDFVSAHVNLGTALIELGRFDEAIAHLEHALRIEPNHAIAFHNLGDLALTNQYTFSDDQLQIIETLAHAPQTPRKEATTLYFILAGTYQKQARYDQAFQAYQRANDSQRIVAGQAGVAFDYPTHLQKISATQQVFSSSYFQKGARFQESLDSELPVFIVGMPRSGTTLVEQIIASHPQAAGAGELGTMEPLEQDLPSQLGTEQLYPQCMDDANSMVLREVASAYLERLTQGHAQDSVQRIVDKTWYNFYYLGLIATLFPNARVIHCRRDALDICVSCFFANFNSIRWAWNLEEIGRHYRIYEQLMSHWQAVLPLRMHEVSYERLVANPEDESRDLISFCGLDWDDRCLEFYKTERPVHTASRVQVRQPIYSSSIGRWKHYERHLAPLREILRETDNPNRQPAADDA